MNDNFRKSFVKQLFHPFIKYCKQNWQTLPPIFTLLSFTRNWRLKTTNQTIIYGAGPCMDDGDIKIIAGLRKLKILFNDKLQTKSLLMTRNHQNDVYNTTKTSQFTAAINVYLMISNQIGLKNLSSKQNEAPYIYLLTSSFMTLTRVVNRISWNVSESLTDLGT